LTLANAANCHDEPRLVICYGRGLQQASSNQLCNVLL
jgi:hypothetical protein